MKKVTEEIAENSFINMLLRALMALPGAKKLQ